MAPAAQLRLWWPYIHDFLPHNSGNAAIDAIENAGETGRNIDFGDTEGVVCERVKMSEFCGGLMRVGRAAKKKKKKIVFTNCL